MIKYIIHCDMNNYFASVEMIDNPYLENIPLVVCGDIELRHGIVLSKNNKAKEYGIVTGESVYEAKKKCKDLVYVIADYHKYLKYTKLSRAIYERYTKIIIPYGMDEAWIDVTDSCQSIDDAVKIAREIKQTIFDELKLRVAVGVSFNYIYAKLGSDQKSSDVYVIDFPNFEYITEYFPAFSLLFVGRQTRKTLRLLNILTIGDLRRADPEVLKHYLGKKGQVLYEFAHGDDSSFNPVIQSDEEMKSISNTITSPKDIKDTKEAEAFIYILSKVVSDRLIKHKLCGKTVSLCIKLNDFTTLNRQKTFDNPVNNQIDIYNMATYILSLFDYELPIRSINLRVSNLTVASYLQPSLFNQNNEDTTNKLFEELQKKYGKVSIEKTSTTKDWSE